jgi:hypothetical protein
MTAGLMETARRGEDIVLTAAGAWTIQAAGVLDEQLRKLAAAGAKKVLIVLADLTALDTAGAWLIARTERELRAAGIAVDIGGAKPGHQALLSRIMEAGQPPPLAPGPGFNLIDIVADLGEAVFDAARQHCTQLLRRHIFAVGRVLRHPGRIRIISGSHRQHGSTPCRSSASRCSVGIVSPIRASISCASSAARSMVNLVGSPYCASGRAHHRHRRRTPAAPHRADRHRQVNGGRRHP